MSKKVMAALGAYFALVYEGAVLLIRRKQEDSIIPGTSFYGNWELPGGAVLEGTEGKGYNGMIRAAAEAFLKKTGVATDDLEYDSDFHPIQLLLMKGASGYDLAGMMRIQVDEDVYNTLQGDDRKWASAEEVNQLARDHVNATSAREQGLPSAVGIISGWGKRMHCMALLALEDGGTSSDLAEKTLGEITDEWEE